MSAGFFASNVTVKLVGGCEAGIFIAPPSKSRNTSNIGCSSRHFQRGNLLPKIECLIEACTHHVRNCEAGIYLRTHTLGWIFLCPLFSHLRLNIVSMKLVGICEAGTFLFPP
jgi:hypothetical protein